MNSRKTVQSHSRGHTIYYDGKQWLYVDTDKPIDEIRPCKRCGKSPIFIDGVGYVDACLGYIEGATSVCCGHGIEEKIIK
ncbi:hypothetical protein LJB88_04505 [Erysipelotrichaceae bacterium OttesenSCG-928-M19]|nr:hypothetical protein [Erysipelotrichaceae bacterium OttesenSCG-928-M19]